MFLFPDRLRRAIESMWVGRTRQFSNTGVFVELAPWDRLSFREQEVVVLIYKRLTNEQMAGILSVSLATVKSHLDHIYKKLKVHNRREVRLLLGEWPFQEWWDFNHPK